MSTFHHIPHQWGRRQHGCMIVGHAGKGEVVQTKVLRTILSYDSCNIMLLFLLFNIQILVRSLLVHVGLRWIKQAADVQPCITLYIYIIFNLCLHVTMPTSAALNKEKSIVCCSSICNYRTMLETIHFLSGPPTYLHLSTSLNRWFYFYFLHFCPSSSISPLSSSLFHSLSFLLSQCNVIQDRCWQPQLWHCNLRSALVARQPVGDRARWCTSFFLQKKEREIKWSGKPTGHQPKFKWLFQTSCFQSGAASHLQCSGAYCEPGGFQGSMEL